MEQLQQQVRLARRRLVLQRFLALAPWCLFVGLLLAGVLVTIDKYRPLPGEAWQWIAGAAGLSLVFAAIVAAWRGHTPLEAALEIDRRFELKERVSSALSLSSDASQTAAGQALLADALQRVARLDVGDRFGLQLGRWSWLPLAPAVATFLVMLLLNPATKQPQASSATSADVQKQIARSTSKLQEKLAQRRQEAADKGLKDAEQLFQKLERGTEKLSKAGDADRKQAMVELNDLAKQLQQRQDQLGGADKLRQQLNQMRGIDRGPADELAKAMRQGDLKKAAQELDKLREQLANDKLGQEEREQLAKQLEQMEEKLNKMAQAHEQAQRDLEKQIEEKRRAGNEAEARSLEDKLEQLRRQGPQMQSLQNMASKLGQAAQQVREGKPTDAAQQLQEMQSQLAKLDQQQAELDELEAALDEISQAKDSMACQECDGEGCAACGGGMGGLGRRGMGLGNGRGSGDRPEEQTNSGFYDTNVKQKLRKGTAVVTDYVDGPNVRGAVQQQVQEQFEQDRAAPADPLTGQPLPRQQREHARRYFEALREGK